MGHVGPYLNRIHLKVACVCVCGGMQRLPCYVSVSSRSESEVGLNELPLLVNPNTASWANRSLGNKSFKSIVLTNLLTD